VVADLSIVEFIDSSVLAELVRADQGRQRRQAVPAATGDRTDR
jgi:anti-anti-sigma regulatory factor